MFFMKRRLLNQMMKKMWKLMAALLLCVGLTGTLGSPMECRSQPTCSECLMSPGCSWCKQKDFLKPGESNERRCDTPKSLRIRNCAEQDLINPDPDTDILKDDKLQSNPENVVQLRPQNIKIKLRVGKPEHFEVVFKRAEGYPVDLYYLMDLSYSMKDDLEKVKNLGQEIHNALKSVTKVRIGFGSFVDKVAMPYVNTVKVKLANPCPNRTDTCQPAFSFRNVLQLTDNATEFKVRVSNQKISGNQDSPEAGFDAIMQAAVCQKEIGWGNVTRILVFTTDDTFHMAGDGRLAGIYQPSDGECHLDSNGLYHKASLYDYPSVGHLAKVLSANSIQLIFAVTNRSVHTYKALSELIPQSVVGELNEDSGNVVQLISEAYSKLSSTIILEHQNAPPSLDISYKSHCRDGYESQWQKSGKCNDIKLNQQVKFNVSVSISTCLPKEETFVIKLQGIRDEVKVTVETLCDCDCKDSEEQSSHCNNNGNLHCGICSCDEGHLGQKCECEKQQDKSTTFDMEASCRQNNVSQLCSSHGSCECGRCVCRSPYRGQFCQCDDTSCERDNNLICSGKGTCNCSICECFPDYTGSACQCSVLKDQCQNKHGLKCSNHGKCKCNRCVCDRGFFGEVCSIPLEPCKTYQECVVCTKEKRDCGKLCGAVRLSHVPGLKQYPCQSEVVIFKVELEASTGNILVYYTDPPGTVDMTYVAVGSSVSGIILIGILIIIIYRLLLELYYRREFHNFEKEKQNVKWNETQNPLFQDATTTVYNPLHENSP